MVGGFRAAKTSAARWGASLRARRFCQRWRSDSRRRARSDAPYHVRADRSARAAFSQRENFHQPRRSADGSSASRMICARTRGQAVRARTHLQAHPVLTMSGAAIILTKAWLTTAQPFTSRFPHEFSCACLRLELAAAVSSSGRWKMKSRCSVRPHGSPRANADGNLRSCSKLENPSASHCCPKRNLNGN